MSCFAGNQVFRLRRESGPAVFLKLAEGPGLRREVAVLEVLAPLGVPVPVIEAADQAGKCTGATCVILREVSGEPASCSSPAFAQAGQALRHVHEVRLGGHGSLSAGLDGLRGQDQSWAGAIASQIGDLARVTGSGLIDARLIDRASAAVSSRRDLLNAAESGHLLHGDFNPRHVFAQDGRVTGIIDWGDAICGDPVYDFGRVLHSAVLEKDDDVGYGLAIVNRVLAAYGDAPWLRHDLIESLLVYATAFTLRSMHGELAGGAPWPPWWPAQATALTAILDAL